MCVCAVLDVSLLMVQKRVTFIATIYIIYIYINIYPVIHVLIAAYNPLTILARIDIVLTFLYIKTLYILVDRELIFHYSFSLSIFFFFAGMFSKLLRFELQFIKMNKLIGTA